MNDSPTAYSKLVTRLLQSPRYGEQMARHWLDVVRYADTAGFSNDYERPNAWRYRDYVIRAFNNDKPYNRFVVEQLAGDATVLAELEAGRSPWPMFRGLRHTDDDCGGDAGHRSFQSVIAELRQKGGLHNDDTTLLRVEVA